MYSQGNRLQARLRGASLICSNLANSLDDFFTRLNSPSGDNSSTSTSSLTDLVVYCWRGGHRSASLALVLSNVLAGVGFGRSNRPLRIHVLAGGYKSWRRLVMYQLAAYPIFRLPGQFWIVSGLTGSGKTLVLNELEQTGEAVIDLERLANHKGSVFGLFNQHDLESPPVNQRQFETCLHQQLVSSASLSSADVVWTESESRSIGPYCSIPLSLWKRLRPSDDCPSGPFFAWLDVPEEARVAWLVEEYAELTRNRPLLETIISKLRPYQPQNRISQWLDWVAKEDFTSLVTGLVRHQYDPLYKANLDRYTRDGSGGCVRRFSIPYIDRELVRNRLLPQLIETAHVPPSMLNHATVKTTLVPSSVAKLSKCFSSLNLLSFNNNIPPASCQSAPSLILQPPSRSIHLTNCLGRHPGMTYKHHVSFRWAVDKLYDSNHYTVEPLQYLRTGGRGPDGHIQYKHRSGGLKRPWFLVDYNRSRHVPDGKVHEELVLKITKNWWRHPYIALVASGEIKRWILATEGMKVGDIIRSHVEIPYLTIDPCQGDAHPVGALPVGTVISQIELRPGTGAASCRAAGTSATIARRGRNVGLIPPTNNDVVQGQEEDDACLLLDVDEDDCVMVRLNGEKKKRLMRLDPRCIVVVGPVSNGQHNQQKFHKFGEKRWRGIKQRSGLWQRKTGRFGRKIRPLGPPLDYILPEPTSSHMVLRYTLPKDAEHKRARQRQLASQLHPDRNRPAFQPTPGPHNASGDNRQPQFRW